MKDLLMNCYYEGMTIEQSIEFITRCYDKAPTEKQLENAKKSIKQFANKEWE